MYFHVFLDGITWMQIICLYCEIRYAFHDSNQAHSVSYSDDFEKFSALYSTETFGVILASSQYRLYNFWPEATGLTLVRTVDKIYK